MGKGGRKGGQKKRGGGNRGYGENKYFSGAEAVKARNRAAEEAEREEEEGRESGSDAEEVTEQMKQMEVKEKKQSGVAHLIAGEKVAYNEDKDGIRMTRRQQEELAKQKRERAYREAHARGETDEAKADLARLKAVRERREAAKKEKEAAEQKEKEAEAAKRAEGQEYRDALGSDAAKVRGQRSKEAKAKKEGDGDTDRGAGNDRDMYVAYANAKSSVDHGDHPTAAAKAAEEDFM